MSEIIDVTARAAEALPERVVELQTEIKALHRQYRELTVSYAVEIGRRLKEAKELLPHGSWGGWLRDNVEFSQRTASDLMRMFEEYGAAQQGLLGAEVKSQAIADLSVTQAVRLLALPAEEREELAGQAAQMSTRELAEAIRERDEARKAAEDAEQDAKAAAEQRMEARRAAEEAAREKEQLSKLNSALEDKWAAAKKQAQELEKKLSEKAAAPVRAVPDPETEKALQEARAEAERLRKELKASDAAVAEFRVYFEGLQVQAGKIEELLGRMEEDKAAKLRAAVRALLQKLLEGLGEA